MRYIFHKKPPQMKLQPKRFWKTASNQTRNKFKKKQTCNQTTTKTK